MRKRVRILEPAVVYNISNFWIQFSSSSVRSFGGAETVSTEAPTTPSNISAESINPQGNRNLNANVAIAPVTVGDSDKEVPLGSDEAAEVTQAVQSSEGVLRLEKRNSNLNANVAIAPETAGDSDEVPLGSDEATELTQVVQSSEGAPTLEDAVKAVKESIPGTSKVFLINSGSASSPRSHRGYSGAAPPAEAGVHFSIGIQETEAGLELIPAGVDRDSVEGYGRVSFPETDDVSVPPGSDGPILRVNYDSVGATSQREDDVLDADIPLEANPLSVGDNSLSLDKIIASAVTFRSSGGATSRSSGGASPRGSTKKLSSTSPKGSKGGSLMKKSSATESGKSKRSAGSTGSIKTKGSVKSTGSKSTSVVKVQDDSQKAREIKFDPDEPFSDDCVRFQKSCPCCHCTAVRCAIRKASFYLTPQGKKQLEAKRDMKNFFMDINAMSQVRWGIEAKLYGTKEPFPSSQQGFPICITKVKRLDKMTMCLTWYVHDYDNIDHYEIRVDGRRKKIVHNPQQTETILLDVNATCNHTIIMSAVPKVTAKRAQSDRLVQMLCCEGGLEHAFRCTDDPLQEAQNCLTGRKERKNLIEFWKPSQFFYIPQCKCKDDCDCGWGV